VSGAAQRGRLDRFPGFEAQSQARHWDPVTSGVVLARTGMPPDIRFFTPAEQAVGVALCEQLLDQGRDQHSDPGTEEGHGHRIPVLNMIDARLAEKQTDGWRYDSMPHDGQAWRDTLAALDQDAEASFGTGFAACSPAEQAVLIQRVQDLGSDSWHGLCAKHVWSLWTRYICTAFYSHPSAWDEMGFPGPAYPRGYKNIGVNALEPFEVRDTHPNANPVRGPQ
jgi:hypothetical protein